MCRSASCTPSSAQTAPASRPWSASLPARSAPRKDAFCSVDATSRACRRIVEARSALRVRFRSRPCSLISPCSTMWHWRFRPMRVTRFAFGDRPAMTRKCVGRRGPRSPASGLKIAPMSPAQISAMASATFPRMLVLDEPMAGMGPDESARMIALLDELKGEQTILLIEHDMDAVFRLADRITVLVDGRVIACGTPDDIRADAKVHQAYLGGHKARHHG